MKVALHIVAERQGFEPWVPLQVQRISNPSRSTTPAPLQTLQFRPSRCQVIKKLQIIHRIAVANLRLGSKACSYPGGGFFGNHQGGSIGVAARDGWHNAGIDDA